MALEQVDHLHGVKVSMILTIRVGWIMALAEYISSHVF